MTSINLTALLNNPNSPKFASNKPLGNRTLFPLKFTPDAIRNGSESVGTIISGSTYPCTTQKTGPVAEGTKSYSAYIAQGGYQPWGYRENFPAPVTKGAIINLQWSLFFPADYNWTVDGPTGGGRLKFMRIMRRCTDFKYIRSASTTGTVPALGSIITQGAASGTFAGIVSYVNQVTDTVAPSLAEGTTLSGTYDIRLTNTTGVFTNSAFSSAGMSGTFTSGGVVDGEGYIDLYMLNAAFSGAENDGILQIETENYGGINNGPLIGTNAKLTKGQWETIEIRVVLDPIPMSMGGTARIQLWRRVGQQMVLMGDVQNTGTINRDTSECVDLILFNYWNGASPASQTMYLDRIVKHFNPATLVETCSVTGVKIIGGVSP